MGGCLAQMPADREGGPQMEEVDLVGPELMGGGKYRAAAALGGQIYALPCHAQRTLRIDSSTGECQLVGPDVGSGADKYRTAVVVGHCIYGLPFDADRIIKIDGGTGEVSLIGPEILPGGDCKFAAAAVVGSCIYGVPCSAAARQVIRVDCSRSGGAEERVEFIGPELPDEEDWKYMATAVVEGRWVYGIPYDATRVLRIDGGSGAVELLLVGPALRELWKYRCAATVGRRIYCLPFDTRHLLRITHGEAIGECHVEELPLPQHALQHSSSGAPELFSSCVALPSGQIYGLPRQAKQVLRVDGHSGRATVVGPELHDAGHKYACGVAIGDFIYALPDGAHHLLRINTKVDKVETLGPKLLGSFKYLAVVVLDDAVFGIPECAERTLRIRLRPSHAEDVHQG